MVDKKIYKIPKADLLLSESPVKAYGLKKWLARNWDRTPLFYAHVEGWPNFNTEIFFLCYCKYHTIYYITYRQSHQLITPCPLCAKAQALDLVRMFKETGKRLRGIGTKLG